MPADARPPPRPEAFGSEAAADDLSVPAGAGRVTFWSDVACPWATVAAIRLDREIERQGVRDRVLVDHRTLPLELVNSRPTPPITLAVELEAARALEPGFGWQTWSGPAESYPATVLAALEAVQAAKRLSLPVSARLDLALRYALFAESRQVGLLPVVVDVAAATDGVDADALAELLYRGVGRAEVISGWRSFQAAGAQGSPHLFLADGRGVYNPGVDLRWEGDGDGRRPVVDDAGPHVYEELVRTAAQLR